MMNRRETALRESKRKVLKLEIMRRKRNEINDLINKELRIRNGAQNLLNACKSREIHEKLRVEIAFMDSKITYLKDQLAELNCDWSVFHSKCAKASELLESHYLSIINKNANDVNPPESSSSSSSLATTTGLSNTNNNNTNSIQEFCNHKINNKNISPDIMIYLALKETSNKVNFEAGFKQFINHHYQEDPNNYIEQIKQFNYFRESTIRLSYEPDIESIKRLFEYYNSLILIEKRFFRHSQCSFLYFTWYDCINGIQYTQKSIQFEKASILFNCAALFTQIAAVRQNGNDCLLSEQKQHWQSAAGCLNFINTNFSNAPSLDMSNNVLELFVNIFMCQAYEIEAKILLKGSKVKQFSNFISVAKIFAHISDKYTKAADKINANQLFKSYFPEIWFFLIKVKALHFKSLAHYFSAMAVICNDIEKNYTEIEIKALYDSLHDYTGAKFRAPIMNYEKYLSNKTQIEDQSQYYTHTILQSNKKYSFARAHLRESIVLQEEAVRQHSFCRKFYKNDYLHDLLRYYHDISLEKFNELENRDENTDNELFEVLPINFLLSDTLVLDPTDPKLDKYEAKDFFNLIGPIKVYSSENDISVPYTCILKKLANQQTYGITVKGDCPVRVNFVDPKSCAYHAGIREGDYIIAIQDQDVRWSKHAQVVEKIRSCVNFVKLTLINVTPIYQNLNASSSNYANQEAETDNKNTNNSNNNNNNNNNHKNKKLNKQNKGLYNKSISAHENLHNQDSIMLTKSSSNTKLSKFSFNTITIGRKIKKNAMKFNLFSSFKNKYKPELASSTSATTAISSSSSSSSQKNNNNNKINNENTENNNKKEATKKKNELLYKTI